MRAARSVFAVQPAELREREIKWRNNAWLGPSASGSKREGSSGIKRSSWVSWVGPNFRGASIYFVPRSMDIMVPGSVGEKVQVLKLMMNKFSWHIYTCAVF